MARAAQFADTPSFERINRRKSSRDKDDFSSRRDKKDGRKHRRKHKKEELTAEEKKLVEKGAVLVSEDSAVKNTEETLLKNQSEATEFTLEQEPQEESPEPFEIVPDSWKPKYSPQNRQESDKNYSSNDDIGFITFEDAVKLDDESFAETIDKLGEKLEQNDESDLMLIGNLDKQPSQDHNDEQIKTVADSEVPLVKKNSLKTFKKLLKLSRKSQEQEKSLLSEQSNQEQNDKEADKKSESPEPTGEEKKDKPTFQRPPTNGFRRSPQENDLPMESEDEINQNLTRLFNEAKCFEILKSDSTLSNDQRKEAVAAEAKRAEVDELKTDETTVEKINQLVGFLSRTEEAEQAEENSDGELATVEAVIKELSDYLKLDSETVAEIFQSQRNYIWEEAKQRELGGRSFKKRLGYTAARLGIYGALGIAGAASGVGGALIGSGIGAVRLFDRYVSEKISKKQIIKKENELKESIRNNSASNTTPNTAGTENNNGRNLLQEIKDNFFARLALAKQEQINQRFVESEQGGRQKKSKVRRLSDSTISEYLTINTDIKNEDKKKIISSLSALAEIDNGNQNLAEQITAKRGFKAVLTHKFWKGFSDLVTGKGETDKEKILSAAIFLMAGAVAREVPLVRRALLALAGARAGELFGDIYFKKHYKKIYGEEFKAEITANALKAHPELLDRARLQLLLPEFQNKPRQYQKLKKQVEKMIEAEVKQKVTRAEDALTAMENHNKQLFDEWPNKKQQTKSYRNTLMLSRLAGAGLFALLGEMPGLLSGGSDKIGVEQATGQPVTELKPEITAAVEDSADDSPAKFMDDLINKARQSSTPQSEKLIKEFADSHRLLEQTGAEIAISPDGATQVVYEIGRGKDFSALDQALRRLVVQEFDVGIDNQFDAVEAARAENVLANLRVLLGGNKIAGLDPERLKDIASFSDNRLQISDYGRFEQEILSPLFDRANHNIQTPDNVMEYVNRTSLARWQEMFNERQAADSPVKVADFSSWRPSQSSVGSALGAEAKTAAAELPSAPMATEFNFAWQPMEARSAGQIADFTTQAEQLSDAFKELNAEGLTNHPAGDFEALLKDINGDGRPDAWLIKSGGNSLEVKIEEFNLANIAQEMAAVANNIDNISQTLGSNIGRDQALDFLSQAQAAGIEGVSRQNFEPGGQFENLLNSFKGERLALLQDSHGQFDPSHFEIFRRLYQSAPGKVEQALRLTKNLDWDKEREVAFGVLLSDPHRPDSSRLMADIFGRELAGPAARLDEISDKAAVFKRLGGLGGKVKLDFINKEIVVGSEVLSSEIKKFKLNDLAGAVEYLTNKQK